MHGAMSTKKSLEVREARDPARARPFTTLLTPDCRSSAPRSARLSFKNPVTGRLDSTPVSSELGRIVLKGDHEALRRACEEIQRHREIRLLVSEITKPGVGLAFLRQRGIVQTMLCARERDSNSIAPENPEQKDQTRMGAPTGK